MSKKFTVAILGTGARGYVYGSLMKNDPHYQVVALCDQNPAQIEKINALFHLPPEKIFYSDEAFFAEKRADVLVIATHDRFHVPQCLKAMALGYDVLMEKPVSDSAAEIEAMLKTQAETGRTVVVCHVLRYSAPFIKLGQLIRDGAIGTLLAMDILERVVYWHQAQAYVRLQSEVNDIAHPTILAKCCHDLDYIQHYAGARCETVSSTGGLAFFRRENAPAGATARCLDCPHMETCLYSAKKIYIDRWHAQGEPPFVWPYNKVSLKNPNAEEDLYAGLRTSPLGKCVFLCGVAENEHVVDHQMVQMHFENGVDAHLKMLFAAEPGRRVNLFGTHGEILMDERNGTIEIRKYGEEPVILSTDNLFEGKGIGYGHGGGDQGIVNDLYRILTGEKKDYTSLTESLESHLMGIRAEESRLNGGVTLKVHG